MKSNIIELRPSPDTLPCDTEPGEIEAGLRVPALRAEDSTWLGRWLGRLRRKEEPTTFGKCLGIHCHFADPSNRSALR